MSPRRISWAMEPENFTADRQEWLGWMVPSRAVPSALIWRYTNIDLGKV
jgi:hypothetical protein